MLRKTIPTLFTLSLFVSFQALAFPGEIRRYFKDWLVVCQKDHAAGTCRANVSVRDKKLFPYGDGTIFQLTLERKVNSNYHIEFYHTLDDSYPSNTVELTVDNHPSIILNIKTEGNLAKLTSKQSSAFIPLIKAGRWLSVSYVSQTGKHIKMKLSLRGSSASLLFVDSTYLAY